MEGGGRGRGADKQAFGQPTRKKERNALKTDAITETETSTTRVNRKQYARIQTLVSHLSRSGHEVPKAGEAFCCTPLRALLLLL